MPSRVPVVIVGAGPTGLTAAVELARRGIECRIVDEKPGPVSTSNALAVQPRTLEIWSDEGILEQALELGVKIRAMNMYAGSSHIARITFDHLLTAFRFQLAIPQSESERLLATRLAELGGRVEHCRQATTIQHVDDGVRLKVRHLDGKEEEIEAFWAIACDGAHSTVREQLGLSFAGSDLAEHFIMADLPLESDLPKEESHVFFSPNGGCGIIHLKNYSRLIFEVTHDSELAKEKHPALEHFIRLAKERCPVRLELGTPLWISGLWTHQRICAAYRVHRVFLAGDAAHVHSPVGGQGMNTGIQDAYNLVWKLANVIRGHANLALLDSYEQERRPIAIDVLRQTTRMTHMVSLRNPLLQTVRNLLLKRLVGAHGPLQMKISRQIANFSVSYSRSCITNSDGKIRDGVNPGDKAPFHPALAGIEYLALVFMARAEDQRAADLLEVADELMARFTPELVSCLVCLREVEPSGWSGRTVADGDSTLHASFGVTEPTIFLIRPDKYISFRGSAADTHRFRSHVERLLKQAGV